MASINKRGEYQWEAQVRRQGYPNQSKTFVSKAEAQAWASTVESEMARGIFVRRSESERTTLEALILRYLSEVAPQNRGAEVEKMQLRAILRDPLAKRFLATLTGGDFATFRDNRLNGRNGHRRIKPATSVKELQLIKRILNIAKREWDIYIPENPVGNIRLPRVNNARTRRLQSIEEQYLMAALEPVQREDNGTFGDGARNFWARPAICLAIATAMRRGEILGLRWKYVDLHRRVARLPVTKNGDPRDVPLSSEAIAILKALPQSLDGRVFPISPESLKKCWQRAITRAKDAYCNDCANANQRPDEEFLVDFRFHDLRHEATTRMADRIRNPLELARITGHRDLKMLLRYYNVSAEELAQKLG